MAKLPASSTSLSLPAFYNVVMAPHGFQYPAHLNPVNTALADQRIRNLMLIIGPGSGKSNLLSVVYPLYELGLKPDHTILSISAAEGLPQGFMQGVMEVLDKSPHYKRLFPGTRPDKKAGWSMERGLYTTARPPGNPDASYRAAGLTSKLLVGKHAKLIILDDLHTEENSATVGACEKVISSYYQNLIGRADPQESRFVLAGRRWSVHDVYGHLQENGDWVTLRLPADRGPGQSALYYDVYVPLDMECVFTEGAAQEVPSDKPGKYRQFRAYYGVDPMKQGFYWPESEVKRRHYLQVKRNDPATTAATYQGSPGGNESGVFLPSDFRYLPIGNYPALTPSLIPPGLMPPGSRIIQGWDVSHTIGKNADYSVCTTAIISPCQSWHNGEIEALVGKPDSHYDVTVVDVWKAQVEFGGLVEKMRELSQLWNPSFIAVEKNTGSIPVIQALQNTLPIVPMSLRNSNKKARAVIAVSAGTASVQGWLRQGRVQFWEEAPWLHELKTEMLDFTGDGSGHDDMCFVAGTQISMADGTKKSIELLKEGDLVDTPYGPRPVLAAGLTGVEDTWEAEFNGGSLVGTGNHPVYCNDDWVTIDSLPWNGYIYREREPQPWHSNPTQISESNLSTSTGINIIGTQIARDPHTVGTTPGPDTSFTGISGNSTEDQSQQDSTSTTSTGTGIITRLRTLLAFPAKLIGKSTRQKLGNTLSPQTNRLFYQGFDRKQQSGTAAQKDSNGTDSMWPNLSGNSGQPQPELSSANTAPPHSSSSWTELDSAVATACITVGLKHTQATRRKEKVYNLTVAGAHCYFANGILVHNCDSLVWVITQAIALGSGTPLMPSDSIIQGREGTAVDHHALAAQALAERSAAGYLISQLAEAEALAAKGPPAFRPGQAQPILPSNLPEIQVCQNCRYRDRLSSMCVVQSRKVAGLDVCQSWSWDGIGGAA